MKKRVFVHTDILPPKPRLGSLGYASCITARGYYALYMNNKLVSILVGLALVAGIGAFVWHEKQEMLEYAAQNNAPSESIGGAPAEGGAGITAAEVALHGSADSCWSMINGNVYDLTSWIPEHPGGPQAILQLCGKDGSQKFNKQHAGQALQEKALAGFKIGAVAQ